ncbi:hypothetical protein PR048_003564 [Dryococelus australis]|uniref:Uncharacterized protein n=1 Tax=Dryococelus australis TaxID=614101 RepID=A0ABQ9INI7_9NEOP|nr:hypothetical protein PR048_003564 [Dryococelus australis]
MQGRRKRELPEKTPPNSCIVRHDSHMRESGTTSPEIEPGSSRENPRWRGLIALYRSHPVYVKRAQFAVGSLCSADDARSVMGALQLDSLDPAALNNTRKVGTEVVFFNRVPKVGSQTFMELLRRLAIKNQFAFHRDHIQRVETIRLSPVDQRNDGYIARLARWSDEALEGRVSVARIAPSLLDFGRAGSEYATSRTCAHSKLRATKANGTSTSCGDPAVHRPYIGNKCCFCVVGNKTQPLLVASTTQLLISHCPCSLTHGDQTTCYRIGADLMTSMCVGVLQMSLAAHVNSFAPPAVYVKHVCFTNFTHNAGMKGREKREIPEKTRRPAASSSTRFPFAKIPGVTRPEIGPGSSWWEASRLTARPSRPFFIMH